MRSTAQPAARKAGASAVPVAVVPTPRRTGAAAALQPPRAPRTGRPRRPPPGPRSSAWLRSYQRGAWALNSARPNGSGSSHCAARRLTASARADRAGRRDQSSSSSSSPARRITIWSSSIVTVDGPVAGPVLGVDGVVRPRRGRATGRSPPRRGRRCPRASRRTAGPAARPRPPRRRRRRPRAVVVVASSSSSDSARRVGLLGGAASSACAPPRGGLLLGRARPRPRARRRSPRRPRRAGRSRRRSRPWPRLDGLAVRRELVLALERLDLLDGDLELMGDPGVGAALAHPRADLVELGSQRRTGHDGGAEPISECPAARPGHAPWRERCAQLPNLRGPRV